MTAVDPQAIAAEVAERIAANVVASVARREHRRQQRAELQQRRTAGLRRRHARKLTQTQQDPQEGTP